MDKDRPGGTPPELEDILEEFAPKGGKKAPPSPQKPKEDPVFDTPPVPEPEEPTLRLINKDGKLVRAVPVGDDPHRHERPRRGASREEPPAPPAAKSEKAPERPPEKEDPAGEEKEKKVPWWRRERKPRQVTDKVIELPTEDRDLTGRLGKLIRKADDYAAGMFPDDEEKDPEEELRERLLPGVDYEDEPTHAPRPRRRPSHRPKPDTPPGVLAKKYGKGLRFLHARVVLSLLWCLPQLYLMAAPGLGLPLPQVVTEDFALSCQIAALALGVSALLALDVLGYGLMCLLRLQLESETLLLFAVAVSVADALTVPIFPQRAAVMPYCGVMSAALFFALWGRYLKRGALRQSCRVAANGSEPYLVTLDEKAWNGQDAFMKWSGETVGYGSQIQAPDGAQRVYHIAAPLILLSGVLLALVASVGQRRPQLFFWSLSAILTAGCGFTCFLTFPLPFAAVARRLAKIGGALGGWDGICWGKRGVGAVLTDGDLFPPGSVTLNGIKLVGDMSLETLVSYAATLVREMGSGMDKPFRDLLHAQGSIYRRCSGVVCHEGGVTGIIAGRQVYVGSGAFMTIMKIPLPQGLNVKNAAFCAVDGHLEGLFVLNYQLHFAVRPALNALIANSIDPILATRDFDIIPEMLRKKFKLPVDRMEFPSLDRRRELSSPRQEHAPELAAVLCREGLGPYADAVVGGKRLVKSVRLGLFFDLLGAAAGVVLAFYLTASAAFAAVSAETMFVFLLLWMVPAGLISGWVNRY